MNQRGAFLPWLIFIAVGLAIYTCFVKLSARVLRYGVPWKSSFFFAIIMLGLLIFVHVVDVSQPVAIRIGHGVLLLLGFIVLGGWFFSGRGTDSTGAVLGWGGGMRLIALAVGMMIVVALAIVFQVRFFSASTFPRRPNQSMTSTQHFVVHSGSMRTPISKVLVSYLPFVRLNTSLEDAIFQ